MFRNFVITVLFGVALAASVALAKDAPFPIFAVRGTWEVKNDHGMKISVETGQRLENGEAVAVRVVVTNGDGQVLAKGEGVHRLNDVDLVVELKDSEGHAVRLILSVDGEDSSRITAGNFELKMILEKLSGDRGVYILGR